MNILFVMDPLKKCDPRWDNSLYLLWELEKRGHACWAADTPDLFQKKGALRARCKKIHGEEFIYRRRSRYRYKATASKEWAVKNFQLIIIRKEPPVDEAYHHAMRLLESVKKVPMVNHPRGIQENNEKLSILNFPKWIPKSTVSSSPEEILQFQAKLRKPVVVKPLNLKSGKGIFVIKPGAANRLWRLNRITKSGKVPVMAQEFLKVRKGEKRIVLVNGKLLCAYEKRARKRDFRANLSLGATFHRAPLTVQEKKLCNALRPFLLQEQLLWVGIDVLDGKLIEINVTSPAGITEAKFLWPEQPFVEALADFLEVFSRQY